jgi:rare lipoprotein A
MKIALKLFVIFTITSTTVAAQDSTQVADSTVAVLDDMAEATKESEPEKATDKILTGTASYYAAKFEGRKTANGEIFRHSKFTAACNVLPLGTWIEVTNIKNGKKVIVKTNDRLHPKMTRIVDLTKAAAVKLDFVSAGLAKVKVRVLGKKFKPKP